MFLNEYEKWRMRQNPITARLQVGGRAMPSWFSASLVRDTAQQANGGRRVSQQQAPPIPPSPPAVPPPVESEYEDIDNLPRYSNTNSKPASAKRTCSLCGNPTPVVRCELCNNQIFCGSCNDMYHRHPKRHNHVRKLLETVETRPPLPPKLAAPPDAPVPPPRRRQKFGGIRSATSSPVVFRKAFFPADPMGSLRRPSGMEQRPLPPPPQPPPPLPPKSERRNSSPAPPVTHSRIQFGPNGIPTTVMEMTSQRHHFNQNAVPNWNDDRNNFIMQDPRQQPRNQSMSTTQLDRFNSSSNLSHIATLQRRPKKPIICGPVRPPPPVLPQRSYPPPQQTPPPPTPPHRPYPQYPYPHQSIHSASAFNLNQMDDPRMQNWPPGYPYPFGFDQGPPQDQHPFWGGSSTMKRTPSTSSMTNQPVFNPWSAMQLCQAQPLTASERELEMIDASRRGSEPPPPYGNQLQMRPQSSMNQPVSSPFVNQNNFEPETRPRAFSVHHWDTSGHQSDSRRSDTESKPKAPLAAVPDGFWSCEFCTLLNADDTKICNACCKTRTVIDPPEDIKSERSARGSSKSRSNGPTKKRAPPPPVVKSVLSFSRNDSRTQVEKQVIKVDPCSDEDLAGETSSSEESDSDDPPPREGFTRKKFINKAKTPLTSSNEEVYGSIPLQTLTIGPPRRLEKEQAITKVSTAVGSSPPNFSNFGRSSPTFSNSSNFQNESSGRESVSKKSSISSGKSREIKPVLKQISVETATVTNDPPPPTQMKTSKGTSPPPQSISTQTYEELPSSKLESKSVSRSSIMTDGPMLDEPFILNRKPNEISDKELRYSRRAQQQSKLKRSMSTHLTSSESATMDPWGDTDSRSLYRSSSRHSLASEPRSLPFSGPPSRDVSPPPSQSRKYYQDLRMYRPPSWERFPSPADYFASIEDLVNRRRKDSRTQEFELTRLLKDAAEFGYSPEDVQVALRMCGERNPIKWLQDNWNTMVETVQTLASKYGHEKGDESNEVGTVSTAEAKDALRQHRGNVWVAVTECVEQRRKKFLELQSRGNFLREDILTALTANHGKLDAAYVELSKAQLKPFLMQIWGPPAGIENETAPSPMAQSVAGSSLSGSSGKDEEPEQPEEPQVELPEEEPEIVELEVESERLEQKRGSIEDESFVDAPDDTTLDQVREKEVIGSSSDLEESEAFVSDLLQNFQISKDVPSPAPPKESQAGSPNVSQPTEQLTKPEPAAAQPVIQQPQAEPAASQSVIQQSETESKASAPLAEPENTANIIEQNQPEKTQDTTNQASTTNTAYENTVITPNATAAAIQALAANPSSNPGQIQFSMDAVLELLEKQRIKLLQEREASVAKEIVNPVPQQQNAVQPEIQQQQPQQPQASHSNSSANTSAPTALVAGSTQMAPPSTGSLRNNSSGGSPAHDPVHQRRSPMATIQLQTQSSTDSGDLDPSIYEEVDSGENISEYIRRNSDGRDEEISEEEDSEEDGSNLTEDSEEVSLEQSDDDELIDEIYERIEPMDEANVDIPLKKSPTVGLKDELKHQEVEVLPDLTVNLKPEVKRLIEQGSCDNAEQAEVALQLMDMKFPEEDAVQAAKECSSIYSAMSYLQQECHLCATKFSATQMVSMLRCTHWCCKSCAKEYFMVQIRDHGILDATCPFCKEPSNLIEDPDTAAEYFNHLDIMLKNILDDKHHEMFQRKLRDWALSKTPNFKWCSKCSSGFITEPLQTRLVCPDCSAVTCAVCLEPWDRTHDHRDQNLVKLCDATKSVVDYLNDNCVECPRCRSKFALARGGCMHLTCSQCKFEYCSGCSAPFRLANKCNEGPFCLKLGLHAHHPRNCLFYLRDKEAADLAKLLEEHAIPYLTEGAAGEAEGEKRVCRVSIQRETEAGLQDDICGNDAPAGYASVCQGHYIEYLGLLISQNHLDPVPVLSNDDLETIIKRAHKKVPSKPYGTKDADFRLKLLQVIKDEIPL